MCVVFPVIFSPFTFLNAAAVAVGYSAALLRRETRVLHIDSEKKQETAVYEQLSRALSQAQEADSSREPSHSSESNASQSKATRVDRQRPPPIIVSPFQQQQQTSADDASHNADYSQASFALVIDGLALADILESGAAPEIALRTKYLLALAKKCESVLCCRISPQLKVGINCGKSDFGLRPILCLCMLRVMYLCACECILCLCVYVMCLCIYLFVCVR